MGFFSLSFGQNCEDYAQFTNLNTEYCNSAGNAVTLTVNGPMGTFSGAGVQANGLFNPIGLPTGNTNIVYTFTNPDTGTPCQITGTTTIYAKLPSPNLDCLIANTNQITVDWSNVNGAVNYNVNYSINGGAFQNIQTNTSVFSLSDMGFMAGDVIQIQVQAISNIPCANSSPAQTSCVISDCPILDVQIENLPTVLCAESGEVFPLSANISGGTFTVNGVETTTLTNDNYPAGSTLNIDYELNQDDCLYSSSFQIFVDAVEASINPASITVDEGDTVNLIAQANAYAISTFNTNWGNAIGTDNNTWNDSFVAQNDSNVIFWATNNNGCSDTATAAITVIPFVPPVLPENVLNVPNVFTPNGDNLNDVFFPVGVNIESYEMQIFDRWGNLIFEGNNTAWDGIFKAEYAPAGVYMYYIIAHFTDGTQAERAGNVSILR